MGEWGQAGDDSWEGGGEEGEAAAGERGMGDSATDGGEPLRSVTIGFLYVCCVPSVSDTPATLRFLYVQATSSRFPVCCPSGQQYKL
jgi:hypothetical protein